MACNLTAAIALSCLDQIGGVRNIWISTDFAFDSITAGATSGITALTGGTGDFYQVELPKDTASFTETFNVSQVNGTAFFDQAVIISVQALSSAKRQQIQLLAYNRASRVIVEDNNGVYWLVGLTRGCSITAGTTTTGTAPGDATQYNLTLSAQEPEMIFQVSALTAMTGCAFINVA